MNRFKTAAIMFPDSMIRTGRMIAVLVVVTGISFSSCRASVNSETGAEKMNILFIAVDDLKPDLNCFGKSDILSPNIDRLARNGVVFLNNHCQQAVCGPSRASLLTGLRPDHTKVWDLKTRMRDMNPDVLALPQYFRQNGYSTVAVGKIYDPRCVDREYDAESWSVPYKDPGQLEYMEEYGLPLFSFYLDKETRALGEKYLEEAAAKGMKPGESRAYALQFVKPSVESADVPDDAYMDGAIKNEAIRLLRGFAGENDPFFLAVGFKRPHLPFAAPKKYWDLYDRDKIKASSFQKKSVHGPDISYHYSEELRSYTDIPDRSTFEVYEDGIFPVEKQKELIHGYNACVSYIDALVGELISELKSLQLDNNTIIVLWGDHGWHLGDHGLWCKHSNFEQATRSPLIVVSPGTQRGIKNTSPTEFIDIFPTLCELTGLEIPEVLDGTSLVPILNGSGQKVKDFAVSQFHRGKDVMGYSLRTEQYRYTEWTDNSYRSTDPYASKEIVASELYDYIKDPLETINVVDEPGYMKIKEELALQLQNFLMSFELRERIPRSSAAGLASTNKINN